uniref:Dipeptidase n=1 Tax=Biomphalaria glabrata TaxID=6526 RepID=A0A2C9JDT8_BIOGL
MALGSSSGGIFGHDSFIFRKKYLVIGIVAAVILCTVIFGVGLGIGLRDDGTPDIQLTAEYVLSRVPLVDGHNDLAYHYRTRGAYRVNDVDLHQWAKVETDIARLRQGKLGAQFWSAFMDCDAQYSDALRISMEQVDIIKRFIARYPDVFQFVTTAKGIRDAFAAGKIGSLIGLEGGHSIDSSLGILRMYYDLGVRYMTLTHSCNTPWADNWMADDNNTYEFDGLSSFGEVVVKEMNRLGMIVDLSHVSYKTMDDALLVSKAPVIFSHSGAYAKCAHNRNVRDDILTKLKANGGMVMVMFYPDYINCSTTASADDIAGEILFYLSLTHNSQNSLQFCFEKLRRCPNQLTDQ